MWADRKWSNASYVNHFHESHDDEDDDQFLCLSLAHLWLLFITTIAAARNLWNPKYEIKFQGLSAVRRAVSGSPLPSVFHVAEKIHTSDKPSAAGFLTTLAPVWSQLLLNDVSDPVSFADLGANEDCCTGTGSNSTMCIGDGVPCHHYSRTASAPRRKCRLGAREQMNGATSFLDASTIYGSTEEAAHDLRTFDAGFLKTSYGDLLPTKRYGCPPADNR